MSNWLIVCYMPTSMSIFQCRSCFGDFRVVVNNSRSFDVLVALGQTVGSFQVLVKYKIYIVILLCNGFPTKSK